MTLSIELPAELAERVAEEAARRGQEPAEFARSLLEDTLAPPALRERHRRVVALLDEWSAEDAASGEDAGAPPEVPRASFRDVVVA